MTLAEGVIVSKENQRAFVTGINEGINECCAQIFALGKLPTLQCGCILYHLRRLRKGINHSHCLLPLTADWISHQDIPRISADQGRRHAKTAYSSTYTHLPLTRHNSMPNPSYPCRKPTYD